MSIRPIKTLRARAWACTVSFFVQHKELFKRVAKNYQEIIFWLPPAIGMVFLTRWLFPQIDPTSGIDGLGQLNAMVVNTVGGIMVCFSAWITKRTYDRIFTDEDIRGFDEKIISLDYSDADKKVLLAIRLVDLLVWVLCFYFWYRVIFG